MSRILLNNNAIDLCISCRMWNPYLGCNNLIIPKIKDNIATCKKYDKGGYYDSPEDNHEQDT